MNPFTDWTPEQQCFGASAFDQLGYIVVPESPKAVQWCAWGRLRVAIPELILRRGFEQFIHARYHHSIDGLNDIKHWRPSQFAAAWDEFQKEQQ